MPTGRATLLDVATFNNPKPVAGLIENALLAVPEITDFPCEVIPGTEYIAHVRKETPEVGWREANTGVAPVKSGYKAVQVNTFILDASFESDEEVVGAYPGGPHAYIAMEQTGLMVGALQSLGRSFFLGPRSGVSNAKVGMPGLLDFWNPEMVVDAGGATKKTSVWIVAASNQQATPTIHLVFGRGGKIQVGPARQETLRDKNGNGFDGWRAPLKARVGLHAPAPEQAIVRIKNLSTDDGKGLTDEFLAQALEKFPTGRRPTHIFLNKRSLRQLRLDRYTHSNTVYGEMGTNPVDHDGIKLYPTDSIFNNEESLAA